jgi:predicted small lipoprotein YifL
MKKWFILLLALCGVLSGCGKKQAPPAQPTPEQAAQIESEIIPPPNNPATPVPRASVRTAQGQPAASAPAVQQAVVPIQQRINGAIHAQLTVQLRMYMEKNGGRMPQSFSEFAFRNMDTVPAVPEGMKYVIDPVDRTVKVVKKQP